MALEPDSSPSLSQEVPLAPWVQDSKSHSVPGVEKAKLNIVYHFIAFVLCGLNLTKPVSRSTLGPLAHHCHP